ncbi:MAG: WYL domain-containing protein, partial [Clostridia bacterium]|nr:WYL domain-containing protein [Clostridia bacterium]
RIKHYRVDKMNRITIGDAERQGKDVFKALDMSAYTSRNFSMFAGEEADVVLDCDASVIGVIVDRFGTDVSIHPNGDRFTAFVRVAVSEQFFGWVAALGGTVRIVSPQPVKEQFLGLLDRVRKAQQ